MTQPKFRIYFGINVTEGIDASKNKQYLKPKTTSSVQIYFE